MEPARHHTVHGVKRLLDAIAMITIDIDIQDAQIRAQKLERAEGNVVGVAEPGGKISRFFSVLQPSCPVDHDVGCSRGYLVGCTCRGA